jgi:sugar/nucleoside kinase (ribokinase family)
MNFWIDRVKEDLLKVLKRVNVLIINDSEARLLSKEPNLIKAAKIISEMGPKYLIIKKGEHGALLFGEDTVFSAPAYPMENIFDPTGAGDAFAGGFTGYLYKTQDFSFDNLKRAVIYGSVMASFCVEKFQHKRIEDLSFLEIQNRFIEFKNLSNFS